MQMDRREERCIQSFSVMMACMLCCDVDIMQQDCGQDIMVIVYQKYQTNCSSPK